MLSLCEGLLFVSKPADLLMSWHLSHIPKWPEGAARKILVKKIVVGQKVLIIRRGCIIEQDNYLEGLQGVFGENRKLYNCSIITKT